MDIFRMSKEKDIPRSIFCHYFRFQTVSIWYCYGSGWDLVTLNRKVFKTFINFYILPFDKIQFMLLLVWIFSREKPDLLMVDVSCQVSECSLCSPWKMDTCVIKAVHLERVLNRKESWSDSDKNEVTSRKRFAKKNSQWSGRSLLRSCYPTP